MCMIQSLGVALYCKLSSNNLSHMDISKKAVEINSELGDDVNYVFEDDLRHWHIQQKELV